MVRTVCGGGGTGTFGYRPLTHTGSLRGVTASSSKVEIILNVVADKLPWLWSGGRDNTRERGVVSTTEASPYILWCTRYTPGCGGRFASVHHNELCTTAVTFLLFFCWMQMIFCVFTSFPPIFRRFLALSSYFSGGPNLRSCILIFIFPWKHADVLAPVFSGAAKMGARYTVVNIFRCCPRGSFVSWQLNYVTCCLLLW